MFTILVFEEKNRCAKCGTSKIPYGNVLCEKCTDESVKVCPIHESKEEKYRVALEKIATRFVTINSFSRALTEITMLKELSREALGEKPEKIVGGKITDEQIKEAVRQSNLDQQELLEKSKEEKESSLEERVTRLEEWRKKETSHKVADVTTENILGKSKLDNFHCGCNLCYRNPKICECECCVPNRNSFIGE